MKEWILTTIEHYRELGYGLSGYSDRFLKHYFGAEDYNKLIMSMREYVIQQLREEAYDTIAKSTKKGDFVKAHECTQWLAYLDQVEALKDLPK